MKVTWEVIGNFKTGTIKSLKDDKICLVEIEGGSRQPELMAISKNITTSSRMKLK